MRRIILMLRRERVNMRPMRYMGSGRLPLRKQIALFLVGIAALSTGVYLITDSADAGFLIGLIALLIVALALWLLT